MVFKKNKQYQIFILSYKSMTFSWSYWSINHMGYENNPTTGSSEEFWAMY